MKNFRVTGKIRGKTWTLDIQAKDPDDACHKVTEEFVKVDPENPILIYRVNELVEQSEVSGDFE